MGELTSLFLLLKQLLDASPLFIPAAIMANLTPSLISFARKLGVRSVRARPQGSNNLLKLNLPLVMLDHLLTYDIENNREIWRSAVDAGVVPFFIDLLDLRHEPTIGQVLRLSGLLFLPVPAEEIGSRADGLSRAIARLLTANLPVAPAAAKMLSHIAMVHPKLVRDWHTWGIEDTVQRLTTHSDLATAGAALDLKRSLFRATQKNGVS
jgi:hypothetical protein